MPQDKNLVNPLGTRVMVTTLVVLFSVLLAYAMYIEEKPLQVVSEEQHRQLIAEVDESQPGAPEVVHSFDASIVGDSWKQIQVSWIDNLSVSINDDNSRYLVLITFPCALREDTTNTGYTIIGNASMAEEGEFRDTLRRVTFFTTIDNAMLLSFAPRTDVRIIGTTVDFIDHNVHTICES